VTPIAHIQYISMPHGLTEENAFKELAFSEKVTDTRFPCFLPVADGLDL